MSTAGKVVLWCVGGFLAMALIGSFIPTQTYAERETRKADQMMQEACKLGRDNAPRVPLHARRSEGKCPQQLHGCRLRMDWALSTRLPRRTLSRGRLAL